MDYTLGPALTVKNGGCLVRINDDIRKCVVYLGLPIVRADEKDDITPQGTGFLVAYGDIGGVAATYIVTARHVARALADVPFAIRLNDKQGNYRLVPVDRGDWVSHSDNDVAAIRFDIPAWADAAPFAKYFALPFKIKSKNIGIGDLVYIVGLFNLMHGNDRNLPIVHTGHIAMVPEGQKVTIKDSSTGERVEIEAYLVEGQALSGASGAPVFVRRSIKMTVADPESPKNGLRAWLHGSVWMLGLWSASYAGSPSSELVEFKNIPADKKVPYGVGVVVAADKIIEVLDMPQLKEQRDAEKTTKSDDTAATTDSLPAADDALHKERFTALLGAAAKTKTQGG